MAVLVELILKLCFHIAVNGRGQTTFWIITEIMCANKIEIEAVKSRKADMKASVKLQGGGVSVGDGSGGASSDKDVRWSVSSSSTSSSFPFAFKALRVAYDDNGDLISTQSLTKSQSLKKDITVTQSSYHHYISSFSKPYHMSLSHHNVSTNQSFDNHQISAIPNPSFDTTTTTTTTD